MVMLIAKVRAHASSYISESTHTHIHGEEETRAENRVKAEARESAWFFI